MVRVDLKDVYEVESIELREIVKREKMKVSVERDG